MSRRTLAQRIIALHDALSEVPHAFGGAIALAYYAEPRATVDIDLNVFVPPDRQTAVTGPLRALGVVVEDAAVGRIDREGQVRVWWDDTAVDLFFAYDRFHDAAAAARRVVPFADREIPILSAEHLMVCKVVFNRARDWVDIDAMRTLGEPLDTAEVLRWVARLVGDEDPRYERIVALLTT